LGTSSDAFAGTGREVFTGPPSNCGWASILGSSLNETTTKIVHSPRFPSTRIGPPGTRICPFPEVQSK
jgi:hypothetical protein